MFQKLLLLAIAGAAGTILRFVLSSVIEKNLSVSMLTATAVVNILGCIMFGLIWAMVENKMSLDHHLRAVIFIGFFGAFTTFSSFAFETVKFVHEFRLYHAFGNILLQNLCGFAGIMIGLTIGKYAG